MKSINRIVLFIITLSLLVSCSFLNRPRYSKLDDEFTGKKIYTVSQYVNPTEKKVDIGIAKLTFQRILLGNSESLIAYFVINRYSNSFDLENKGFLRANEKNYAFTIDKKNTQYKTSTTTSSTNSTTKDSTKVSSVNTTETSTSNWYEEKFTITFNEEIALSLKKGKVVYFRFYFGPQVATYKLNDNQIQSLKKIFKDT